MEENKHFMIGNLVRNKITNEVIKITSIDEDGVFDENSCYYVYNSIEKIPLTDEFFKNNAYHFETLKKKDNGRVVTIISTENYIGPAITKYESDIFSTYSPTEYCIAGIIIRTVDEYQNLMNICRCSFISDKIKID